MPPDDIEKTLPDDGELVSLGRCEALAPVMRFFLWGLRNLRRVEDLPAAKIENP